MTAADTHEPTLTAKPAVGQPGSQAASAGRRFPWQPLTIIVPWPAGSVPDRAGRLLAVALSHRVDQTVEVVNIEGAGGLMGTLAGLAAPADGHTMWLASPQETGVARLSNKVEPFSIDDVTTVAKIGQTDLMLVVRPNLPVETFSDFVALMKSRTDVPLSIATAGRGTIYSVVVERLHERMQTTARQVPFPSMVEGASDVAAGVVDFAFVPIITPFDAMVEQGQLRALAVFSDRPNPRLPQLPLVGDTPGFEDMNFGAWCSVQLSSKVPLEFVNSLHQVIMQALEVPALRTLIDPADVTASNRLSQPEAHAEFVRTQQFMERLAKAVGVVRA